MISNNLLRSQENYYREIMDISQTADFLGLKVSMVRALVFKKQIPYFKIGRLLRFKKESIDIWFNSKKMRQ